MNLYEKMYLHLFNAVTDALRLMPGSIKAAELLRQAQSDCEEMYMEGGESPEELELFNGFSVCNSRYTVIK